MNTRFGNAKSIDTRYGGHLYRSRLEARWAVFFDTLGIQFEYEPEGFELPGGIRYLPDFWLPKQNCWIEIKPGHHNNEEGVKASLLATATNKTVYVSCGLEGDNNERNGYCGPYHYAFFPGPSEREGFGDIDVPYVWCECQWCGVFDIQYEGRSERIRHDPNCKFEVGIFHSHNGPSTPDLIESYSKARQFRFDRPTK